jgi:hypothetical protein
VPHPLETAGQFIAIYLRQVNVPAPSQAASPQPLALPFHRQPR